MNTLQVNRLASSIPNEARLLPSLVVLADNFVQMYDARKEASDMLMHLRDGFQLMLNWDAKELQIVEEDRSKPIFAATVKECQAILDALKKAKYGTNEFDSGRFIQLLHKYLEDERTKWRASGVAA